MPAGTVYFLQELVRFRRGSVLSDHLRLVVIDGMKVGPAGNLPGDPLTCYLAHRLTPAISRDYGASSQLAEQS